MKFTRNQIIFLTIGGVVALVVLLVLFGVLPGRRGGGKVTELIAWGIEDARTFKTLTGKFEGVHPELSVKYRQFSEENYEKELLNALSAGEKPDILMFENNWLFKHGDKLTPALFVPPGASDPIEKISPGQVSALFPKVVEQDFVADGKVYALPLYIDTLAMVYNRDIFDRASTVFPPATWEEAGNAVGALRLMEKSSLKRGAYALGGTSKSMTNAGDIVQAMLLQGKVDMANPKYTLATFGGQEGRGIFAMYTRFSNPSSSFYSWNDSMPEAKEALARGDVAAIFIYSKEFRDFKARNAFLDVGIAPLPQLDPIDEVNIADYWGLAVFGGSKHPSEAWDFVLFATANKNISDGYLAITGDPPALRTLIERTLDNPILGVFAGQALTARSWPQPGEEVARSAFDEAIRLVLSKELTPEKAIQRAESLVTEAIRGR